MDGGQKVWAPHPEEGYQLGLIVDVSTDTLTVEPLDGGKSVVASYDEVFPAADEGSPDVDDNCSLMYLNEATLLHNLRMRYGKTQIYTYVANILLAVNPNKEIQGLYSSQAIRRYNGRSLGTLPPHVFAIADKAYREMKSMRCSQSIIVSGESGAGKTESTKFILRYLTESYGAKAGIIEQRIVEANPLLESFGNAKTMRNNNSSRFGKFSEIHYNSNYEVVGGHVSHYLLEKSRICSQSAEERNYHVFYRMLAGAPQDMRQALGLQEGTKFNYLNPASLHDAGLHDREEFSHLTHSMDSIGLSQSEKADLFRVVAAVLHLGNVSFDENLADKKGGSVVSGSSMTSLEGVASLLGLEKGDLQRSLTSRVMTTTKGGAVGTIINVPLKPDQASNARDALAKALYTRLFSHIVKRVNQCFPFQSSSHYIGVLDIAGFEYFQVNSFEQFCINYCNEKLQQFFNSRILREEQDLYKKESLGVTEVMFMDNQDCIDLIEQKKTGVIDLLDEECKLPKGSPQHFTDSVFSQHKEHFRLCLPRKSKLPYHRNLRDDEGMMIRHFAGAVCYVTCDFLDKNNDALHASLEQMVTLSKDNFIKQLFSDVVTATSSSAPSSSSPPGGSRTKKLALVSVGSKFRTQLNTLMEKLKTTGSSFIRCLKPNLRMVPGYFVGGQILSQLQCAGMISVLELMQGGYPSRAQFADLYKMYQPNLPAKLSTLDPRTFCRALFRATGMRDGDFKFGISKVFFRPGKFAEFDEIMKSDPDSLREMVAKVQSWLVCTRWRKVIFGAISVQKLARKIRLRAESAVKVQKYVRMFLAIRQHRPRFQGMVKLKQLNERVPILAGLVSYLKKDKSELVERVNLLQSSIDQGMTTVKTNKATSGGGSVKMLYSDLLSQTESFLEELRVRQERQRREEEEAERLRKIREEKERKEREERERLQREKEENEKRAREEAEKLQLEREKREREEAERLRKIREEEERERRRREEEAERLRQLQEAMERERKEREEEEKRRLAEEEERKRRAELEARRVREEEERKRRDEEEKRRREQIEADRRLAETMMQQEEEQWKKRREAAEQERRDYELAVRLAQYETQQKVIADSMAKRPQAPQSQISRQSLQRTSQRQLSRQQEATRKKYDYLTKWKFAELRDTINTSCDLELLDACRDEFHRRLRVYHAWKERNARRDDGETPPERPVTNQVIQETQRRSPVPPPLPPPRTSSSPPPSGTVEAPQRYFRVPFMRPVDRGTLNRERGWWYAHFDGQWEVRQLELHPGKEPLLMVAGRHDMQMCALSLDETGLTRKQGAEILEEEFEGVWRRYGGQPYVKARERKGGKGASSVKRDLV